MRNLLLCLFCLTTLVGYAQATPPVRVPPGAVALLEDLKELTKAVVVNKPTLFRPPAETRPEINRLLVLAADDFVRVSTSRPTKEAYLQSMDRILAELALLTSDDDDRLEIAAYYEELLEIVGLASSEGRLNAFAAIAFPKSGAPASQ